MHVEMYTQKKFGMIDNKQHLLFVGLWKPFQYNLKFKQYKRIQRSNYKAIQSNIKYYKVSKQL